jgi:hypothetical protein
MSHGGEQFEEKMKLLQQKIEHHVQEEENVVFKQVRDVLSGDELKRLGEEMKVLFTQEMAGEPSERLMTGESAEEEDSAEEVESAEEMSETSRL